MDPKRIYLVGHSLGGALAIYFGMQNPDGIAAVAARSPSLDFGLLNLKLTPCSRRPLGVWVGADGFDKNFFAAEVIRDAYTRSYNMDVLVRVLAQHQHNDYYTRSGLAEEIWAFLKDNRLPE